MTKRIIASELGLEPHWKVRIVVGGGLLHFAARTEPVVRWNGNGQLAGLDTEWMTGDVYGDTLGFIDWSHVMAVSWRWSP